jgi:hypothetical protein
VLGFDDFRVSLARDDSPGTKTFGQQRMRILSLPGLPLRWQFCSFSQAPLATEAARLALQLSYLFFGRSSAALPPSGVILYTLVSFIPAKRLERKMDKLAAGNQSAHPATRFLRELVFS